MGTKLFATLGLANGTLPRNIGKDLDKYFKIVFFGMGKNWNRDLNDIEKQG